MCTASSLGAMLKLLDSASLKETKEEVAEKLDFLFDHISKMTDISMSCKEILEKEMEVTNN